MRLSILFLLATLSAACGERAAVYDAVFAENEGAVFIGAGSADAVEALLLCEPSGGSDWPPVVAYLVLPEAGESIDDSDKDFAVVDGRRVPLRLSLKIDRRDIRLSDFWVQQHEDLRRAIIVGGVEDASALARALEGAKKIEFEGDSRRLSIDVSRADNRAYYADICKTSAASAPAAATRAEGAVVATKLTNGEIEAAITGQWRRGDAAYEKNGLLYRISAAEASPPELPADAQARGIKAYPGVGLEGAGPPFATVAVAYAVFDDPAAADAYFSDADFNLGEQEVAEVKIFRIERDGYPVVTMNCVFVPDANNSVNCHYRTPDRRIVAMILLVGGPSLDFSGDERAIDLVFANEAARDRASLAASASWAYLYDAVYR